MKAFPQKRNTMNKTLIIIQREFMTRVKKKSFILLTVLMPFVFAALIFVPVWLASIKDTEQKEVRVVDATGHYAACLKENANYLFVPCAADSVQFYAEDNPVEAVLIIGGDLADNPRAARLCSRKEIPADLLSLVTTSLNEQVRRDKLQRTGVEGLDRIIEDVQAEISLTTQKRNAEGESMASNTYIAMAAGFIFTFLIYMFVMTYGAMVMSSVLEEKTNRIVELMVSSVKPFQLMMGKIIGVALTGFLQLIIWAIMLLAIILAVAGIFGVSAAADPALISASAGAGDAAMVATAQMSDAQEVVAALVNLPYAELGVMFVLYFVGGYLLYASFFAAVGASVNAQEDSSQFVTPVVLIMIFGLYAAMYSVENTNGPLAFWASMFPLTSPIVMMVRIPFGVPLWQELLSLGILFATSLSFIWLCGKIYRVGILMYGKKPTVREMIKWIRYK